MNKRVARKEKYIAHNIIMSFYCVCKFELNPIHIVVRECFPHKLDPLFSLLLLINGSIIIVLVLYACVFVIGLYYEVLDLGSKRTIVNV